MSTTSFEDFIQRYTQLQAYESSKDKLLQVCMRARTADIMIPFARPRVAEHLAADDIKKKTKWPAVWEASGRLPVLSSLLPLGISWVSEELFSKA